MIIYDCEEKRFAIIITATMANNPASTIIPHTLSEGTSIFFKGSAVCWAYAPVAASTVNNMVYTRFLMVLPPLKVKSFI